MKVVILCGGKGTRIREVNDTIPKPMLTIGTKPILEHIMNIYSHYGFNDFILCLGYNAWKIKEYFLNYRFFNSDFKLRIGSDHKITFYNNKNYDNWNIIFADTEFDTMTGARVYMVKKYIKNQRFMLTYGDGVANINIKELLKFHLSHKKIGTVTAVRPVSRFGELKLEGNKAIKFEEKPQTSDGYINGGFFIFEPEFFDYLSSEPNCVLEREPLRKLAEDGQLMCFIHKGFWMPMDTPREYEALNEIWKQGKAPWRL